MIDTKKVQQRLADLARAFQALLELHGKDKTKLNRTDKSRIRNLESELELILEPEPRSVLTVDVATIASFFGVSVRQVQNWVNQKNCPKLRHGMYDLKAVYAWHMETIIGVDSREIEDAKLKYWTWKAEREKIGVETTKTNLIPKEDVQPIWTARMAEVSSGLAALSKRLPPVLEGMTVSEMQAAIDDEVTKLKETFCRTGRFCE